MHLAKRSLSRRWRTFSFLHVTHSLLLSPYALYSLIVKRKKNKTVLFYTICVLYAYGIHVNKQMEYRFVQGLMREGAEEICQ